MKKRILKISFWFFGSLIGIVMLISGGIYFFKDDICNYVWAEVNKNLKTNVSVEHIDLTFWGSFPNLSVDFNKVFIQDAYTYSSPKDTLLFSERIRLKFNPIDIWNENYKLKRIEISPGTIQLKVNRKGEPNYDIIKPSADSGKSNFELSLQQVELENVRLSYRNSITAQEYKTQVHELSLQGDFTKDHFDISSEADILVKKARSSKVTLLANKPVNFDLKLAVNKITHSVEVPKAVIQIAKLPFEISGKVTNDSLDFEIHSKNIELAEMVNKFSFDEMDEVKQYDGKGKVYLDLLINGKNDKESMTNVMCDFGIENGSLIEPLKKVKVNNIQLSGQYSNKGGASHEFLKLKGIRFTTPGGPFSGNISLTQFDRPRLKGNADGVIDLNMLHTLFDIPYVDKINGNLGLETDFELRKENNENGESAFTIKQCEGQVSLNGIELKLRNDHRTFSRMTGSLYLKNEEAGIDNVSLKVGSSDLKLDGIFRNVMNYIEGSDELTADLEISGNFIDLQDLGTTTKEEKIKDERDYFIPDNIRGTMYMNVGEIKYEKHRFKELAGTMQVYKRKLHFPQVSLQNAEADISGNVSIEERSPEIFHITTQVSSQNLEFKKLFREWDNFHQEVIGEDNIYGKAMADVYFEAPFDLRSGIISKSIKSQVYLKITEGRLKNVGAFKSITESLKSNTAKMVLGKDNIAGLEKKLTDLRFETLENTFTIEKGVLAIPQMMIKSSALDIETSGTHSFDNEIDYRFAFRLRDLKEKQQVTEFGIETDDGTGMKVYMRMQGTVDKPIITWDKTTRKQQLQEDIQVEKETIKSMLKSEFGLFKGDSTIKSYEQKQGPKEVNKVEFGSPGKTEEAPLDNKKQKKDSKIKNTLKNWKEESDKDKQEKIEFN